VAPAGGTKFLLLGGLDRVLFDALRSTPRGEPLHCVGSSIGSFRLACLAASDPSGALERLAEGYIGLREEIDGATGTHAISVLLRRMLGDESAERIADPPFARLHVLTNRCTGLASSDQRPFLLAGLALAAACNFAGRKNLRWQFARVIFHSRGERGPLAMLDDFPTHHARLTPANLEAALLASAAVPLLVPGVSIPSGPEGIHRDGALLDYHPVLPFPPSSKLVLYPHFYEHLTPGWFDRSLPGRRARGRVLDRTVILAPSESFVARLPGGVRPTRRDAYRLTHAERARRWSKVWQSSAELGSALGEFLASARKVRDEVAALP